MEFEIANEIKEVTRNNYCGTIDRSRNQFKQLINKGFYFVDGSAISNAEKERFYSNTRITKKSTALWVRSRCFGG